MTKERTWALVTGGSSGLGIQLAHGLAKRGHNLVLTARSGAALKRLAADMARDHGVQVVAEPIDLGQPDGAARLIAALDNRGIAPDVLVNNAGFGMYEPFLDHDPVRLRSMLQLDIVSLVELTQTYGRRMAARKQGHIMLVGSMAAYQPVAHQAAYSAAKAFVLSFGEALHVELAPNVVVTVLSPGLMDTGFNEASGYNTPPALERMKVDPARVAEIGLKTLFTGRSGVIAGGLNKLMAFSSRVMSRHAAAKATLPKRGSISAAS